MAQKAHSLSHTKWICKYHIVFTPKYRRKIIYNQYRSSLGEIFRRLCSYKGVEIIEIMFICWLVFLQELVFQVSWGI